MARACSLSYDSNLADTALVSNSTSNMILVVECVEMVSGTSINDRAAWWNDAVGDVVTDTAPVRHYLPCRRSRWRGTLRAEARERPGGRLRSALVPIFAIEDVRSEGKCKRLQFVWSEGYGLTLLDRRMSGALKASSDL